MCMCGAERQKGIRFMSPTAVFTATRNKCARKATAQILNVAGVVRRLQLITKGFHRTNLAQCALVLTFQTSVFVSPVAIAFASSLQSAHGD